MQQDIFRLFGISCILGLFQFGRLVAEMRRVNRFVLSAFSSSALPFPFPSGLAGCWPLGAASTIGWHVGVGAGIRPGTQGEHKESTDAPSFRQAFTLGPLCSFAEVRLPPWGNQGHLGAFPEDEEESVTSVTETSGVPGHMRVTWVESECLGRRQA
ncbi:unnamed protein product [Symbiodinium natans]|uniref:Uncharacterized protein n=1 Tax=Symbiodinium natans TaxID=878477 RepID=A0A812QTT8_9DINO|nr:unnamed protein product [Symbiodinium natans]